MGEWISSLGKKADTLAIKLITNDEGEIEAVIYWKGNRIGKIKPSIMQILSMQNVLAEVAAAAYNSKMAAVMREMLEAKAERKEKR